MEKYEINYLRQLESEAIHIIREVVANFKNPVMLYSIGKDSSCLLRLAQKAFYPGKIPFPLMQIDTGYIFKEMYEFREKINKNNNLKIIVYKNEDPVALSMKANQAHSEEYIYHKKTKPLLESIKKYEFDAAIGGSRREEEKSRAKERIFSPRTKEGVWNPKDQRPELWHLYNTRIKEKESMRIFPLSDWTEIDIWRYIKLEKIEVVPLYFAKKRKVIKRKNIYLRLDEYVSPKKNEEVLEINCRYRTLGCSPSTGAVPSTATTVDEIIEELIEAKDSERQNRAIDQNSDSAMEDKKKEGYF
ncbi:MAG: sulfate adenylyltransferase subunit CysD [Patescibacteria group bacterium]|nr:sulfate adenylyltransferase subunit CysD [Patescibacteria group bacterium]